MEIAEGEVKVTKFRFEPSPVMFDGVEIWGIGREIKQSAANSFDNFTDARGVVERSIVHDDGLPRVQFRTKFACEPCAKNIGIRVAIEIKRCNNLAATQPCDKACPPVRRRPAPFSDDFDSSFRPGILPNFFMIYTGFVDENKVFYRLFAN